MKIIFYCCDCRSFVWDDTTDLTKDSYGRRELVQLTRDLAKAGYMVWVYNGSVGKVCPIEGGTFDILYLPTTQFERDMAEHHIELAAPHVVVRWENKFPA